MGPFTEWFKVHANLKQIDAETDAHQVTRFYCYKHIPLFITGQRSQFTSVLTIKAVFIPSIALLPATLLTTVNFRSDSSPFLAWEKHLIIQKQQNSMTHFGNAHCLTYVNHKLIFHHVTNSLTICDAYVGLEVLVKNRAKRTVLACSAVEADSGSTLMADLTVQLTSFMIRC